MKHYVILAMNQEHTQPRNGAPYWRPDAHGYTESVAQAGLYTKEQAMEHVRGTGGDHKVCLVTGKFLVDYLKRWSQVRLSELQLWLQVRNMREILACVHE